MNKINNIKSDLEKKLLADVYVDLDSIVDTRLPLLYFLDEELAAKFVIENKYNNRHIDEFEYVTSDIFKSFYRDRNKSLLALATPTNIMSLIKSYYIETVTNNRILGGDGKITIYLNIYPYELTYDEIVMLEIGLKEAVGDIIVKVVKMGPEELTPNWIIERIHLMIMYSGMEWIEYHVSNLNLIKEPLTLTKLLVPALILGKSSALKDMGDIQEFLEDMENRLNTLVGLKILPVNDFCSIDLK